MKLALSLFLCFLLSFIHVPLQTENRVCSPREEGADVTASLFESDEMLDLRLTGDLRALFSNRSNEATYYPMEIAYTAQDGAAVSIPLKVKTRGNFRRMRSNCFYPPLLLNFSKSKTSESSLFANQDKLKLVTPCRDQAYIVNEYLVYKLYNLITEKSFRARLVRVVYADTKRGKDTEPLYGIILEDEDQMAVRNNGVILKRNQIRPNKTDREQFLKMSVFEYMIANTDWSVQYRQNIKLIADESSNTLFTVPYDFDHAGIVRAPYARPAPELKLASVQDRRYRGFCIPDMSEFATVFALFNELKDDFYRVYTACPLLDDKYVKITTKFLDEFYETINDAKASAEAFGYPCDKSGTGNVVIQGLRG